MNTKETIIALYRARTRLMMLFVFLCIAVVIGTIAILVILQQHFDDSDVLPIVSIETIVILTTALYVACVWDIMYHIARHFRVLAVTHDVCTGSTCTCVKHHREKYLFWVTHHVEPIPPSHSRLELICPRCKRLIYQCTFKEDHPDFEINVR